MLIWQIYYSCEVIKRKLSYRDHWLPELKGSIQWTLVTLISLTLKKKHISPSFIVLNLSLVYAVLYSHLRNVDNQVPECKKAGVWRAKFRIEVAMAY